MKLKKCVMFWMGLVMVVLTSVTPLFPATYAGCQIWAECSNGNQIYCSCEALSSGDGAYYDCEVGYDYIYCGCGVSGSIAGGGYVDCYGNMGIGIAM